MKEGNLCCVDGCVGTPVARGMCARHYKQWRRNGVITLNEHYDSCKVEGCESPHHGKGFCRFHYNQYARGWIDINGKQIKKKTR